MWSSATTGTAATAIPTTSGSTTSSTAARSSPADGRRVLESTMNRDAMRAMMAAGRAAGLADEGMDPDGPMDDGNPLGTPEAEIHWRVDVAAYIPQRRAALEAHRSQATDIEMFLAIPEDAFALMFGSEFYIEPGREPGIEEGWPFVPELAPVRPRGHRRPSTRDAPHPGHGIPLARFRRRLSMPAPASLRTWRTSLARSTRARRAPGS